MVFAKTALVKGTHQVGQICGNVSNLLDFPAVGAYFARLSQRLKI